MSEWSMSNTFQWELIALKRMGSIYKLLTFILDRSSELKNQWSSLHIIYIDHCQHYFLARNLINPIDALSRKIRHFRMILHTGGKSNEQIQPPPA